MTTPAETATSGEPGGSGSADTSGTASTSAPVIGRDAELTRLRENMATGRHTLLVGPIGIGKSFLLRSITAEIPTTLYIEHTRPLRPSLLALCRDLHTSWAPRVRGSRPTCACLVRLFQEAGAAQHPRADGRHRGEPPRPGSRAGPGPARRDHAVDGALTGAAPGGGHDSRGDRPAEARAGEVLVVVRTGRCPAAWPRGRPGIAVAAHRRGGDR